MTTPYLTQWKRFEQALRIKPQSYADLCAITGWTRPTVQKHLSSLREEGKAFIADFGKDSRGRVIVPLFKTGKGADAERPGQRRSTAERMRDLRQRNKAEDARRDALLKKAGLL